MDPLEVQKIRFKTKSAEDATNFFGAQFSETQVTVIKALTRFFERLQWLVGGALALSISTVGLFSSSARFPHLEWPWVLVSSWGLLTVALFAATGTNYCSAHHSYYAASSAYKKEDAGFRRALATELGVGTRVVPDPIPAQKASERAEAIARVLDRESSEHDALSGRYYRVMLLLRKMAVVAFALGMSALLCFVTINLVTLSNVTSRANSPSSNSSKPSSSAGPPGSGRTSPDGGERAMGTLITVGVSALVSLSVALLTFRSERIKQLRSIRVAAYSDFVRGVAGLAILQHSNPASSTEAPGYSQIELEMSTLVADAKARIAIYGSRAVVTLLASFLRGGAILDTPERTEKFTTILQEMRRDSRPRSESVPNQDVHFLLFGANPSA